MGNLTRMSGPRRGFRGVAAVITGLGLAASLMAVSAPAEAEPADPISIDNLPWNADLDWVERGGWDAIGQGSEVTHCLRGDPQQELGAQRVFQRAYELPADETAQAGALIMDFDSNAAADEAYGTLATWVTECEEALADEGYEQEGEAEGHLISIPGTEARFTELNYFPTDGDVDADARSESIGAVRDGNKVALVSMNVLNKGEPTWAYGVDGSGNLLHPMYPSMPKVADRLVG
ncbi:MAG: hypothetical protein ACTH2Q_16120 [Propionibacteriaceae bacterium]